MGNVLTGAFKFFKFLSTADEQKSIKSEKEEKQEENVVDGEAYTVAGECKAIEDFIREHNGLKIIGKFHQTIDGKGTICYIQLPEAESEKMLKAFSDAKFLVWPKKEVKQSTNGYKLNLLDEGHFNFAIKNENLIKFLGSPEIKNNIKESNFPTEIFYKFPNGCYCKPEDGPVGTPNMCAMGVKIDTVKDNNKKNNKGISREDLKEILEYYQEYYKNRVLPIQESAGI